METFGARRHGRKAGRAGVVATAVAIGVLAVPAAALAARPVKPPTTPSCSLSAGVTMQAVKSKKVTSWIVTGTAGDDLIDCSASTANVGVTVYTVAGSDWVWGTPQADVLTEQGATTGTSTAFFGMGGNDRLQAGFGSALASTSTWHLEGGDGDDTILALGGSGYAEGGPGIDDLDLRNGWQAIARGGAGNDQIRGPLAPCTGCSNPLFGDAGNDVIVGGAARDDIDGGEGTDELHGAGADDVLVDSGSGAETFDCGDGPGDIVQDLDGNGTGGNGTGYLNQPEDDDHVDCEIVIVALPECSYTPGTTGCIVLANVAITDDPSTAVYTISGTVTFTPTCQLLAADCDPYPNVVVSGSGTFSVTGSQTASGTWTIPAPPNDRPNPSPYGFTDGTNQTTCAAAAIRQVTFNLPLVASNGDTGGSWLQVRTDDIGTTSLVGGIFSMGPLPAGTFRNAAGSQAGVTILC